MSRTRGRVFAAIAIASIAGLCAAKAPVPPGKESAPPPLPEGAHLRLGTPALRGPQPLRGTVLSSNGKRLATIDGAEITIWNLSGARIASAALPKLKRAGADWPAALSFDSSLVACGADLIAIHQGIPFRFNWELSEAPQEMTSRPSANPEAVALACPANANPFAINAKGELLEWKTLRGGKKPEWVKSRLVPTGVKSVCLAATDGIIAVGGDDGRVRLWAAGTRKELGTLDVPGVRSLAFSGDGAFLASLDGLPVVKRKGVQVWETVGLKEVCSWNHTYASTISAIALSADGTMLACGLPVSAKVELVETKTGKLLHALSPVSDQGRVLRFSKDGSTLVTCGPLGSIRFWSAETGKEVAQRPGHLACVRAVAHAKDGGWVTAGDDGTARLWSPKGSEVRIFVGHTQRINAITLSTDGKSLFTAGQDCSVRVWDVERGAELRKHAPDSAGRLRDVSYESLALSPDGTRLAVGTLRNGVLFLDPKTLKPLDKPSMKFGTEPGESRPVSLAFSGNGRLVSRTASHLIQVWDLETGKEVTKFTASGGDFETSKLAVSPDGKLVVSPLGSVANSLGVWDAETGKLLEQVPLQDVRLHLSAVVFSPDGKLVMTGDPTGTVWVIDLEKKEARHVFKGHRGPVLCLAVSPDGKTLSSGGADTTVLVWKLDKP